MLPGRGGPRARRHEPDDREWDEHPAGRVRDHSHVDGCPLGHGRRPEERSQNAFVIAEQPAGACGDGEQHRRRKKACDQGIPTYGVPGPATGEDESGDGEGGQERDVLHPGEARQAEEDDEPDLSRPRRLAERGRSGEDCCQCEGQRDRIGGRGRTRRRAEGRRVSAARRRAAATPAGRAARRAGRPALRRGKLRRRAATASAGQESSMLSPSQSGAASRGSSSAGKCAGVPLISSRPWASDRASEE